jgi:L-Ala-D/L-Glu epimerase
MRITSVQWHAYSIPLRTAFATAHSSMAKRNGILVEVYTEQDIVGVGEIAPLPEFGRDSMTTAYSSLAMLALHLEGKTIEEALAIIEAKGANISPSERDSPYANVHGNLALANEISASSLCGLDIALLDAWGKMQGVSVSRLLAPISTDVRSHIPVNAVIGAKDLETAIIRVKEMVAAGFDCIKLKVGMYGDISQEVERIAAIREAIGPHTHLRLDANEAWSLEQAVEVLSQCVQYTIQYVEQPLPAHELKDMHALRQAVPLPLAADEALYNLKSAERILDHKAADILIIKAQLAGGLRVGRQIIQRAAERGVQCVVTSTIETGIGVAAALHLAAASPEITLECGLATLDLLVDDLIVEGLPVQNGHMRVPAGNGLGIELDKAALTAPLSSPR